MISISINVTRINKERIKPGKNGKYLDLVLFDNKNGKDQYGNDGFVSESVTKEEREQGIKGAILGNWKHIGRAAKPKPQQAETQPGDDLDSIPF